MTDKGNGLYEFDGVSFVLGTEVNCNGQQGGRSRRVHVLILAPGLEIASLITDSLSTKGKLASDGRPTVHLTPRQLLETLLHIDDQIILIPAHVWTPWFGIFGSKSGFDSLEECFGDLKQHVLAIESGLSSDPAMNWQIPDLDNVSIVSFSDAHSAPKLGRELTKFEGELSYQGLFDDIKNQNIHSTMEFFPDEGKYHSTGHRKCGVCWSAEDVCQNGELCPVCGRKLTLGVSHRVEQLAKRHVETWKDEFGFTLAANGRPAFKSVVGLQQIVAEGLRRGVNTKGVTDLYFTLVNEFESE
ncbi:MAG: DNA helicase UvrD, partial [SAR202 cluster bacterium]|nr:DNA helicase UvrD [SAR202 cluster bacterium]